MEQRHKSCQDTKCKICLADALLLEYRLKEQTGTGNKYDLLGKYHKWLGDNGMATETEFGWPSEETYKEENINSFCSQLTK